ncbi:MAG: LysE family translocator [Rhizobiaceae bacterium]
MTADMNLPLILAAALIGAASPGPTTLTLAGTAMEQGRGRALAVAAGVTTGSLAWSVAAALGLGAVMLANAWMFETLRYVGAGYLLFLAWKSARSALASTHAKLLVVAAGSARRAYLKGLALHLTNPKAILFFGSLYAIGVPAAAPAPAVALVVAAVGIQSALIFHGYALLFSMPRVARGYARLRRWFEGAFALAFGYAGFKILTARAA